MNIADPILIVLNIIVLLCIAFARPKTATCPQGWWLPEGLRRTGEFVCRPQAIGGDDDVLTGRSTAIQPSGELHGRIYCTNGTEPIIRRDGVTVGCQRGGWQ